MGRPTQQEIDDARAEQKGTVDKAYAKSLTVTEQAPAPAQKASAPAVKKAKGGKVSKYARGGGIEQRGKTRGKMC
jgi:hypothetical protein